MKTVYIVQGNLKERRGFLSNLKDSLGDYELSVFDEDDHYDYVSQMITELSCFGERRLFIIKELPDIQVKSTKRGAELKALKRTKVLNSFKKLFSIIPTGNIVLFDNINISSAPFLKEAEKYGEVKKYVQKIPKSSTRSDEITAQTIIFRYFKKTKIDLSENIASMLADSLNLSGDSVDIDKLDLLLMKLYNYVYGKSHITENDVYAVCSTSKEFIVWTLYNILEGDEKNKKYSKAFKVVIDFLSNTRYFQYDATMLIQSMLWRYGLLLMAKDSINRRISKKEIVRNISNIKKLKREGKAQKIRMSSKEDKPEYSIKMIDTIIERRRGKEVLSYYTFDKLLLIYYVISKSLVKIRSGCPVSEIITLLQMILLTICGELGHNIVRDGILEHSKMLRV